VAGRARPREGSRARGVKYIGDSHPGETDYVGQNQAGGFWYAINGAGKVVR